MVNISDQLALGFKKERIKPEERFTRPLEEADFCHEVCGSYCARFDEDYILQLKNTLGGGVKIILSHYVKELSTHHHHGHIYLNEFSVEYILEEIAYYEANNRFREHIDDDPDWNTKGTKVEEEVPDVLEEEVPHVETAEEKYQRLYGGNKE